MPTNSTEFAEPSDTRPHAMTAKANDESGVQSGLGLRGLHIFFYFLFAIIFGPGIVSLTVVVFSLIKVL